MAALKPGDPVTIIVNGKPVNGTVNGSNGVKVSVSAGGRLYTRLASNVKRR